MQSLKIKKPENQTYITETKLSSFNIEDEDIYKIIKALVINKAHGHDEVSIRMWKQGDKSIVKSLSIIFNNCTLQMLLQFTREKDLIKNYCPILLLPIFGKTFKRLIFKACACYFLSNFCFSTK